MRDVVKKWFFGKAEEPFFYYVLIYLCHCHSASKMRNLFLGVVLDKYVTPHLNKKWDLIKSQVFIIHVFQHFFEFWIVEVG
ncbi:hypothetical protein HNP72_001149 [Sphingobacterium soli]|nr:hypothetical protein [Sphingobacterium soli]